MLNEKQILAKVREHFSQPDALLGFESEGPDEDDTCVYRLHGLANSPVRCSVGVLIPDDQYDPSIENALAEKVLQGGSFPNADGFPSEESHYPLEGVVEDTRAMRDLLAGMQSTHDEIARRNGAKKGVPRFLEALNYYETEGVWPVALDYYETEGGRPVA